MAPLLPVAHFVIVMFSDPPSVMSQSHDNDCSDQILLFTTHFKESMRYNHSVSLFFKLSSTSLAWIRLQTAIMWVVN